MPFTYRMHKAFVNLDSGGSMQFRLPPMTKGPLLIKIRRVTVGQTDQPGDHPAGGALPGPVPRVDWDRIGDLDGLRRNRWIAPGRSADWSSPCSVDGYGLTGESASRALLSNSTGDL